MNLHDAVKLAEAIRDTISPNCDECEITGAIYRAEVNIESIEIITVPGPGHPPISFGQKSPAFPNYLESALWNLEKAGKLVREDKAGEKLHKYHLDPSKWGVDLGPATLVNLTVYITTISEWKRLLAFRNAPPPRNAHSKKGKPNG